MSTAIAASTTSSAPGTIWFIPPIPTTGAANPIGQQFWELFSNPASWQAIAGQAGGVVLGMGFILDATNAQLTQVVTFLNANHLKLMVYTGVVPIQPNGVGLNQEGFVIPSQLSEAAQRIQSVGGTINAIGMDEPLFAGNESATGPQLSISALAAQVASVLSLVQAVFPNVQFSDDDGLQTTGVIGQWAQAFQQATGSPISTFNCDMNWSDPNWKTDLAAYAASVRAAGATFGIIGNAGGQMSNVAWTVAAETNIAASAANPAIAPTDVEVTSWNIYPTVALPEGEDGSLSHVAVEASQILPLYDAGYLQGGAGVTVSTVVPAPSYVGSAIDAVVATAIAVPGVQIVQGASPGSAMTYAVVVTDVFGTLSATASGTGAVSSTSPDVLLLTGGLADINAELGSLTYTGVAVGTDTIDITAYDGVGLVNDSEVNVEIGAPITVPLPSGVGVAALYRNIFGVAPTTATLAAAQAALSSGQTLAQVAAPWLAQGQATISALCEQVQGAPATSAALTSLTEALVVGETIAQIRASLAAAGTVQAELSKLYQSADGSPPTASQLSLLTGQLASGTNLLTLETSLLANSQAEATITALYQQVEGQAPDISDLQTQARALLTGTSLTTIQTELASSQLVQGNLALLYSHTYDQSPTAAQLAPYVAELEGPANWAQVAQQFTVAARAEVTSDYQQVLGRVPQSNELIMASGWLTQGVQTNSQILTSLAFSAESVTNLTAMYQSIVGQVPTTPILTALEWCLTSNWAPLGHLGADLRSAATLYHQTTGQMANAAALVPLMDDVLDQQPMSQVDIQNGGTLTMSSAITGINTIVLENAGVGYNFTANSTPGLVIEAGADNATIRVGSAGQIVEGSTGTLHVLALPAFGGVMVEGGTGPRLLEITVAGTVVPSSADWNDTIELDSPCTVALPNCAINIKGVGGNDIFVTTSDTLRADQQISGGLACRNTLDLVGSGCFNLAAPIALNNIQIVNMTEGLLSVMPSVYLRNGTAMTVDVASNPTSPRSYGVMIHGANNHDVINLGSGNDSVEVGGTGETVNGGSGQDIFYVTSATIGAAIKGGSGTNYLEVQGGGTSVMGAQITNIGNVFLLNAGASYNFTANATQGMNIHASTDNNTITVGSATQAVYGSSGILRVLASVGNAGVEVFGNTGNGVTTTLEITSGGMFTLNSADRNVTVKLDAPSTVVLPTSASVSVDGSAGNDLFVATAVVLAENQLVVGGGGALLVEGGGTTVMGGNMTGIGSVCLQNAGTNYTFTANTTRGMAIHASTDSDKITVGDASQSVYGSTGTLRVLATAADAGAAVYACATAATTTTLEITTGGTVTLNSADWGVTVQVDAASTVVLPYCEITIGGSAGNDILMTTAATLRGDQQIDGGGGVNTLDLVGSGCFNLAAPITLNNIQIVDITEGLLSAMPSVYLRNGTAMTVNVASNPTNPQSYGVMIHGANNHDVINLGSGNDSVELGGAGETVNGGSGQDIFYVTSATIGAAIKGGSGTNYLEEQGGGTSVMGAQITNISNVFLLNAGASYNFTANATQGMNIHASTDNNTITVGSATQVVYGSSGILRVLASVGNAGVEVLGNTGNGVTTTLEITSGGVFTLNSADRNVTVKLDAPSTVVLPTSASVSVDGSAGNDLFVATAVVLAENQLVVGGGGALLVEGGGTTVMGGNMTGIGSVCLQNAGTNYTFTANTTQGMAIHASTDSDKITVGDASQSVYGSTGTLRVLATAADAGAAVYACATAATTTTLEITTGGTLMLNSADWGVTVQVDAASTVVLPYCEITIGGSAGNDILMTTAATLRGDQQIDGGGGVNTLDLVGSGCFNLAAPITLNNIQIVDITEGLLSAMPSVYLRNGTAMTVDVASNPTNPQSHGVMIHGANNHDVINLGSGNDSVEVGGTGETVNGGSGQDIFYVTSATIGAAIQGGSGTNYLEVQGGGTSVMGAQITNISNVFLLNAGASYNFTANATQRMVIHAGTDSDTVTVGSASQTIAGSSGTLHVLATATNAGVDVLGGTGGTLLEITTGGAATLNTADNNLTVQLDGATNLTLNHMQFIHAVGSGGSDTICAGAAGQVLTGGGGNDTLEDAGHYGAVFQDTITGFMGDTLVDFTKMDTIDVTNLTPGSMSAIYTGTYGPSGSGILVLGGGAVDIEMTGLTSGSSFHATGAGDGGTLVSYS